MHTELRLTPDQIRAVQAYLRRTAADGRDVEAHGPFMATFSRGTDHPFLNYAIPDDDAHPTPADVAALVAAYRHRRLVPRLEFLPATAPEAERALLDAGFTVELRPPVMVCRPGDAVPRPVPPGIELRSPDTHDERLAFATAQREAFGQEGEATATDADGIRDLQAAGGIAVVARDTATGETAGGGIATPIHDGITELAGFGIRQRFRRRGIATAVTGALVVAAHGRGVRTAFLTPGGDEAERVYARAGFTGRTPMVHLRLEPDGAR